MRRVTVAVFLAAFLVPRFAHATFHLMKIVEVFGGTAAAPDAQYVVLQMYAVGQTFLGGHSILVYDTDGNLLSSGTFTFPGMVSNGSNQATVLIATPQAQAFFGVTPDLTMSPVLGNGGGKVCWDPAIDCVAWGGYSGSPTGVGTPAAALPFGMALKRRLDICGGATTLEFCDDTDNSANDFVLGTPSPRNNAGVAGTIPGAVCGNGTLEGLEGCDDGNATNGDGCNSTCNPEVGDFSPRTLSVDAIATASSDGNGVLESGETVIVAPSWKNAAVSSLPLFGFVFGLTAPGAVTYSVPAGRARYGTIASGVTAGCNAGAGECFQAGVSVSTRPSQHFDVPLEETLSDGSTSHIWQLHVGESFADVPKTLGFYRFIETLLHKGVTGGCTPGNYCPFDPVTRAQMAVFLLVSKEGSAYAPPACTSPVFSDVPCSSPFAKWVDELSVRGVTAGCGGGNYCPDAAVTREQMAVFLLRTKEGPAYTPPACATPMFADVPCSSAFAPWINEIANRGITAGCGNGNYCPSNPNTRGQMAVFLTTTFGLTLYGP